MRNWTIGRKLYSNVGVLVAVMVVSSAVALWGIQTMDRYLEETAGDTTTRLTLALGLQVDLEKVYSAQKSMVMAAASNDQAQVHEQQGKIQKALDAARARVAEIEPILIAESGRKAIAVVKDGFGKWSEHHKG